MKRVVLLAVFFTAAAYLNAQGQAFPDGKFENCWEWFINPNKGPGKSNYWDFKDGYFLSTLNQLHELAGAEGDAPLTAYRVQGAEAYDGYSVKLKSDEMIFGDSIVFLPGVAATLNINFVPIKCTMGRPFTSRPTAIKGVYNYTPVNGDSAAIEVVLKKNGNVVGGGKMVTTSKVSGWQSFNVPITSNNTPDTIVVVFAASGNYDFTDINTLMKCKGQIGSTLWLDNIEFEYEVGIKEMFNPAVKLSVYPNPSKERINIQIAKETNGTAIIYDYLTRKVGEYPIYGTQIDVDVSNYATGSYLINIMENGKVITTGRFVKE